MESRPVVNSDGQEYPSISAAARSVSKTASAVSAVQMAVQATKHGLCRTAGGFQWAYADEVPEVWPEKQPRKRRSPAPKVAKFVPDLFAEGPILPPELTEIEWRPVPGHPEFEVSSGRSVRQINAPSLSPRIERQGVSLVRIQDRLYSIVDLMMLAFIGPKPYGYTVQRLEGESEVLSNLCYAPRKPRKPRKLGMTYQEIMDQLRRAQNDSRKM